MSSPAYNGSPLVGTAPVSVQNSPAVTLTNTALNITRNTQTVFNGGTGTPPTATAVDVHVSGDTSGLFPSGIPVAGLDTLILMINVATFTVASGSPTITFEIDEQDEFGNFYQLFAFTAATGVGNVGNESIGPGMQKGLMIGKVLRVKWVVAAGTLTAATAQITIYGY